MLPVGSYISTLHRLGWNNVLYAAWYKLSLKSGVRKVFFPPQSLPGGTFYKQVDEEGVPFSTFPDMWKKPLLTHADALTKGRVTYFFNDERSLGSPPRWFVNPYNGKEVTNPGKHWTELGDFDLNIGDVKLIWEPSRFYWLLVLARAYMVSGQQRYLETINSWLNDWIAKNPLHIGPNWKCGQETSIRVMHLILSAGIMHQYEEPAEILQELVWKHLQRVEGNINYAIAQDNNHGTSEASALYIGASWLIHAGFKAPKLQAFRKKGKSILEERIATLIKWDGTFSQYSMNYHRMVLDTMSWVLWNEYEMNITEGLSEPARSRIEKALHWMEALLDESGRVPNFGPNDGSLICKLDSNDYRDFRSSVRRLKVLLGKALADNLKKLDEAMFWLGIITNYTEAPPAGDRQTQPLHHFPESGIVRLNSDRSWVLFHYPNYEFRPSHCDFLHVDLWYRGENILRDAGSYSYNTGQDAPVDSAYFKSVKSHNTVSFDDKEPIPKIGRFLYADWPQAEAVRVDADEKYCQAQYRFRNRVNHKRRVQFIGDNTWLVTDFFDGSHDTAELRWRLIAADWDLQPDERSIESSYARISIQTDARCELTMEKGYESHYYMQLQELPVLTVRCDAEVKKIESYIRLK